jgi:hypothetical protein
MTPFRFARRARLLLAPLGMLGCGCTTESHTGGVANRCWPQQSFLADRQAVREPLRRQAQNGQVQASTLWPYHFIAETETLSATGKLTYHRPPRPTAVLTPWGKEELRRIVRDASGREARVYVQVASDAVPSGPKETEAAAIAGLTAKRVAAVERYLAEMNPGTAVAVVDLNPVGMSGREATKGFSELLTAPRGSLDRDAISGTSIGLKDLFGTLQGGQGVAGTAGATGTAEASNPADQSATPTPTPTPGGLGGLPGAGTPSSGGGTSDGGVPKPETLPKPNPVPDGGTPVPDGGTPVPPP